MSSFATEGRALERARPLWPRALRASARRACARRAVARCRGRRGRACGSSTTTTSSTTSASVSREQLRFLAREFTSRVAVAGGRAAAPRTQATGDEVVVTFDDGFRNQLDNAAPLLAEHGFSACFFLVTDLLDALAEQARAFCARQAAPAAAGRAARLGRRLAAARARARDRVAHALAPEPDVVGSRSPARRARGLARGALEATRRRAPPQRPVRRPRALLGGASPARARAAGYESCASAIRGVNRSALDLYSLQRHHLSASWPLRELGYFLA